MFNTKKLGFNIVLLAFLSLAANAENMRPEAERRLAHDIYKEFIEIQSGYTTGATTPVAEVAAGRP